MLFCFCFCTIYCLLYVWGNTNNVENTKREYDLNLKHDWLSYPGHVTRREKIYDKRNICRITMGPNGTKTHLFLHRERTIISFYPLGHNLDLIGGFYGALGQDV